MHGETRLILGTLCLQALAGWPVSGWIIRMAVGVTCVVAKGPELSPPRSSIPPALGSELGDK